MVTYFQQNRTMLSVFRKGLFYVCMYTQSLFIHRTILLVYFSLQEQNTIELFSDFDLL